MKVERWVRHRFLPARWLTRRHVMLVALCVPLGGCDRWRPNTPVEVRLRERVETDTFARVLSAVRARGYAVEEQDAKAGYLRIAAKTTSSTPVNGGVVTGPLSSFAVQIYADKIVLRAYGDLVRNNETIRRSSLDDEIQQLADHLATELGR